ncbi:MULTISPECIES: UPF0158 family protein [Anaerococcus]|uniref:Acyl carrier protein n=1 Tax=Anaerococcus nagyae TaxID=1755241 RepID=A0A3E2TI32_9FIRM|nr:MULTISPECIES: UPF0158 family protein [Anaerococcus]MBP2069513.1 hypothetical protein [Anaerococcus nagyae]MDU1828379.1 UPF0158 family protein [Anaerococcus sp.]MDU1864176.1 UPF0158 family protein [Anaerococcus sp.]MDU2354344.1 UPF0158 family protein [Anaerococcus sp.]MDU2565364.1 UPF0158 family protein [Anaerococcus sp.]
MKKPINLSWLVEKWTLLDEDSYLKSIWINTESLDFIRINQGQTEEDIMENYIDIDNDIEHYVLMPDRKSLDQSKLREAFIETLDRYEKDQFIDDIEGYSPHEEFKDAVYSLGLEEKYNDFRNKVVANILLYWADDEGIQIKKDMETININKI